MSERKHFKCKSEAQKKAIRRNYAIKAAKERQNIVSESHKQEETKKDVFPEKFPFWARLKIDKNRTTLVIDEEPVLNKQSNKVEEGFVHREATHTENKNYEKLYPNPDKDDPDPMYLKRPRKLPKRLFMPHNKELDMPEDLKLKYDKNNHKNE